MGTISWNSLQHQSTMEDEDDSDIGFDFDCSNNDMDDISEWEQLPDSEYDNKETEIDAHTNAERNEVGTLLLGTSPSSVQHDYFAYLQPPQTCTNLYSDNELRQSKKKVSFHESVVTETHFLPRSNYEKQNALYYSAHELQQSLDEFRTEQSSQKNKYTYSLHSQI